MAEFTEVDWDWLPMKIRFITVYLYGGMEFKADDFILTLSNCRASWCLLALDLKSNSSLYRLWEGKFRFLQVFLLETIRRIIHIPCCLLLLEIHNKLRFFISYVVIQILPLYLLIPWGLPSEMDSDTRPEIHSWPQNTAFHWISADYWKVSVFNLPYTHLKP